MFNLEESITEWQRDMRCAGIKSEALVELENHLREEFGAIVAKGEKESAAFELAKARLGSARAMEAEFKKIAKAGDLPLRIGGGFLAAALAGQALMMMGKRDLLLFAHSIAIAGGYEAAFVVGALGCCYLIRPAPALWRAIGIFLWAAAGAIAVGFVLGMLWARIHWGAAWRGDEREMGGMNSLVWTLVACAAHYFGRTGNRATILMSIGVSAIVCQAWFEPFVIASPTPLRFWPVVVFVGLNLCFLAVGLTNFRRRSERG
jgi:hypothetical protein